jgi:hypothetical protein
VIKTEKEKNHHHRHFKIDNKFGYIKACFNDDIEGGPEVEYMPLTPLEYNYRRREKPSFITDSKSAKDYKQALMEEIVGCQNLTLNSTNQMIIAIHSMMVTVYRLPEKFN